MPRGNISTASLIRRLSAAVSVKTFMRWYGQHMDTVPFHEYIQNLCKERGLLPAHIIARTNIDRVNGHQFFSGTRKPPRDRVLQLAFAFGMDLEGAQALLRVAGKRTLHPRIRRDAVLIFALTHSASAAEAQAMLQEQSLKLLGEERYD